MQWTRFSFLPVSSLLLLGGCSASSAAPEPATAPCVPWRPKGGDFASVPTPRPPLMGSLGASAQGRWLYSVGSWIEPDGIGAGVVRSPDLGRHFCVVATPEPPAQVVPSPASATVVYFLTPLDEQGGAHAYRSDDAGATWSSVTPPPVAGLVTASVLDPSLVWSIAEPDGVAVSSDGMETWTPVPMPAELMRTPSFAQGGGLVQRVVVDPGSAERMIVQGIVFDDSPTGVGYRVRVFSTVDAGTSWPELMPPHLDEAQSVAALSIVSDADATVYLAAGGVLAASNDWGETWADVGSLPDAGAGLVDLGTPAPGRLFAQSANGLWESTDGGASWAAISPPDPSFVPWRSPAAAAGVLVGGVTSGIVATRDEGATWSAAPLVPLPDSLVSSPVEPHPLWAPLLGLRSRDGGRSWSKVTLPELSRLVPDGARADTVYAYGGSTLARSEDAGSSWTPMTPPPDFAVVSGMVACPPPKSCLYVLYSKSPTEVFASLLGRSDDGGRTWGDPRPTPPSWFYEPDAMVVDGADDQHLAVTGGDGLAQSYDGGLTWTTQKVAFGVGSIALLPDGTTLVTSAPPDRQLLRSTDGGATWLPTGAPPGRLVTTASRPGTVFSVAGGIYRSDDSGQSFALVTPDWLQSSGPSFYALAEAPGDRLVAASPDFGLVGFK